MIGTSALVVTSEEAPLLGAYDLVLFRFRCMDVVTYIRLLSWYDDKPSERQCRQGELRARIAI